MLTTIDTLSLRKKHFEEILCYSEYITQKGGRFIGLCVIVHLCLTILFSTAHTTYTVSALVGMVATATYFLSVWTLGHHKNTRYIASLVLHVFSLLHNYQLQGISQAQFFFFSACAICMVYRDWKAILPGACLAVVHTFVIGTIFADTAYAQHFQDDGMSTVRLVLTLVIAVLHTIVCCAWARFLFNESEREYLARLSLEEKSSELLTLNSTLAETSEKLAKLAVEAEIASKAKSDFLARISHDLRTPLHGIIGLTRIAREESDTQQRRELLHQVEEAGESLLAIVNDLLDLSKIEVGRMEIVREPFALKESIEKVLRLNKPKCDPKGVELKLKFASSISDWVYGDPIRVEQVLMNLVGNAAKFTLKGSVTVMVQEVKRGEKENFIWIGVQDSGIGIKKEVIDTLFTAFTQDSRAARQFGGTGLGLAICHKLVSLMGGDIGIESEEGKGALFWFTLPYESALPERKNEGYEVLSAELKVRPTEGLRILVAEDNLINQKIAQKILEKLGATVVLAGNGREALELYGAQSFDLICMDCQMPELDGFSTTKQIRGIEKKTNKHIPILAMTANAMNGDRERCLSAGMDGYVSKPFTLEELEDAVVQVLKP